LLFQLSSMVNTSRPGLTRTLTLAPIANPADSNQRPRIWIQGTVTEQLGVPVACLDPSDHSLLENGCLGLRG
jgi:hypothetical protein